MAKPSRKKTERKSRKKEEVWPHLQMAAFCEKALEEKDNVFSIIRVVDRITVPKPPALAPARQGEPSLQPVIPIIAVVMFKSGEAKGDYHFRLDAVWPSGRRMKIAQATMTFLGDENGITTGVVLPAPVDEEGLYWYEVFLGKRLFTRMPLRIVHLSPTPSSEATEQPPEQQQKS